MLKWIIDLEHEALELLEEMTGEKSFVILGRQEFLRLNKNINHKKLIN